MMKHIEIFIFNNSHVGTRISTWRRRRWHSPGTRRDAPPWPPRPPPNSEKKTGGRGGSRKNEPTTTKLIVRSASKHGQNTLKNKYPIQALEKYVAQSLRMCAHLDAIRVFEFDGFGRFPPVAGVGRCIVVRLGLAGRRAQVCAMQGKANAQTQTQVKN